MQINRKQINSLAQSGSKTRAKSSSSVASRIRKDDENHREAEKNCRGHGNESPLRQIGNLKIRCNPREMKDEVKNDNLKPNKSRKIARLLTSKSLSKLMTRSLSLTIKPTVTKATGSKQNNVKLGDRTKSFPTKGRTNFNYHDNDEFIEIQNLPHPNELSCEQRIIGTRNYQNIVRNNQQSFNNNELHLRSNSNRHASDSMIVLSNGLPSSTMQQDCMQIVDDCTLEQANLSPIIGSQQNGQSTSSSRSITPNGDCGSTPTSSFSRPTLAQDDHHHNPVMSSTRVVMSSSTDISTSGYGSNSTANSSGLQWNRQKTKKLSRKQTSPRQSHIMNRKNCEIVGGERSHSDVQSNIVASNTKKQTQNQNQNLKTKTFKPFKTTHLVLRDVKNSLALVSK